MVHWIKGKLYAKNQGPDSRDEKVRCLCAIFETDRQTFWLIEVLHAIKRDFLGRLNAKNQGPKSRVKKDIRLFSKL